MIGLVPIVLAVMIEELITKREFSKTIKKIFSSSNLVNGCTLGIVLMLYFYGNVFGDKPENIGLSFVAYDRETIVYYLLFVVFMVGIYAVCIYRENRRNPLYIGAVITLVCLPLFKMGVYNDLVMRSSIPALFVLFVCCLDFLDKWQEKCHATRYWSVYILCTMLLIGSIHPIQEFADSVQTDDIWHMGGRTEMTTLETYANRSNPDFPDDIKYNYYSYDVENNFFCKYIARKGSVKD